MDIGINQFYNYDTLNIFCDASITGKYGNQTGCYGVVAVTRDDIVDSVFRLVSHTTSNQAEIKGLRAAISLANKWRNNFKNINIFCDSQISVFGLRDYIYNWKYNPYSKLLYGSTGKPIANQEIFIECYYMMRDLELLGNVNMYHQSGHVNNSYNQLVKASNVFCRSNHIYGKIDLNFIRYISTYNNYVDATSRSLLRRSNLQSEYIDPVSFYATSKIKK